MANLTDLTLLEAAAALRAGELSSVELTRACLDRIRALDSAVHAFLAVTDDLALAQAQTADDWLRQNPGRSAPLVHGIPLAVKDVLCVEGAPATAGSRILEGFRPPYTATSVSRLIKAVGVTVGKTNTDDFAMGSSTENSAYGVTPNPLALERV